MFVQMYIFSVECHNKEKIYLCELKAEASSADMSLRCFQLLAVVHKRTICDAREKKSTKQTEVAPSSSEKKKRIDR